MGRHRSSPYAAWWFVAFAVAVIACVSAAITLTVRQSGGDSGGLAGSNLGGIEHTAPAVAAPGCRRVVRVVTAASFAPVLASIAPGLASAADCVELQVTITDGRSAAGKVSQLGADVWIPDDTAWVATAPSDLLAPTGAAGSGTVLATTPIYMVSDKGTGKRIDQAGQSWLGLTGLLAPGSGVRLTVPDPAGSGDGLVAAGDVGESVWLDKGMDASAEALATVFSVTRSVFGTDVAIPNRAGEVGLITERALLRHLGVLGGMELRSGRDRAAMLRYTWLPTAAAVSETKRTAALQRLLAALTGGAADSALGAAGLRAPTGGPPPSAPANRLPALPKTPFPVLAPHHVEHVFATWYSRDRRADLLAVVDVSGSMADPVPGTKTPLMSLVQDGCRRISQLLPDDARFGLWEFGSQLAPPRDYRVLLPTDEMTPKHRKAVASAVDSLVARPTGTGLYDTILAAYTEATRLYRPGIAIQVLVFTDGRNQDDPGSLQLTQLSDQLATVMGKSPPVALTVVVFGSEQQAKDIERAVKPVNGYVEAVSSAAAVTAVFVHVVAGGLHGR